MNKHAGSRSRGGTQRGAKRREAQLIIAHRSALSARHAWWFGVPRSPRRTRRSGGCQPRGHLGHKHGQGDAAVRLALNAGRVPLRSGRHPAAGVPPEPGTCPAAKLMYAGNGARSVKSATMTPYCGLAGGVCRQGGAQWAPDERRLECGCWWPAGRPSGAGWTFRLDGDYRAGTWEGPRRGTWRGQWGDR
jgi:hypothetical protein